jgi:Glyoxalase-like domain
MLDDGSESIAQFVGVSLDCADPHLLADFYLKLLGGQMLWRSADSAGIRVPGVVLAMHHVDGHRPAWPGSSVVHLDLTTGEEVEHAAARAVEIGAVLAQDQPDPRWRVLLDPAGHPFCITTMTPPDQPSTGEQN